MLRVALVAAVVAAVVAVPAALTGAGPAGPAGRPSSAPLLGPPGLTGLIAAAVVQYGPPVPGAVVRPFQPPPTPYAAGHRGVDLAAGTGALVRAAGTGTVRFAGPVAGRGVVVLAHADGITTEYEPVRPVVHSGQAVTRGQVLGRLAGRHAGCPTSCLHWGARRGTGSATTYFDPLTLLRRLGPVVLLPWPRGPG